MMPVAFRYRDFRLLWLGEFVSATGSAMFYIALNVQMYRLTHSPAALGLIGVARFAPTVLLSLPGGVFADAHNRKKILYVTQSLIALCSLLLALATYTHAVTPALLYLLTAVVAAAVAFDLPACGALLPTLVARKDLPAASSVYEVLWQAANVIGPGLAGVLIAAIGVGGVYSIDVVSTTAVILALALMTTRGEPTGDKRSVSLAARREGLVFLTAKPLLWSTLLLDFLSTLLASVTVLLPVYAATVLHVGPQGLGFMYAAPDVGAILMGVFIATRGLRIRNQGRVLLVAIVVYAVSTIIFGLSRAYPLSLLALALVGASDTVSVVIRQNIHQLATPDALRGRLSSIDMVSFMGGEQLGALEAGLLAAAIGAPFAVVLGGVATLGTAAITAIVAPALRHYRSSAGSMAEETA